MTAKTTVPPAKKQRTSVPPGKKTDISGVPVFLRKTYQMVCSSNRSIVSWTDEGTTFVVKDPEICAAEVIPEFFKHNNFSSFVRQLNFYGFRKIKADPLRIREAEGSEESKYWKFRHEKFQEGREDLLVEIRKSNQNEAAEKQEVDCLKLEVNELKDTLDEYRSEMIKMKGMMEGFAKREQESQQLVKDMMEVVSKKQKEDDMRSIVPLPLSSCSIGKKRRFPEVVLPDEYLEPKPLLQFDTSSSETPFLGPQDDLFSFLFSQEFEDMKPVEDENVQSIAMEKVGKALSSLPVDLQNIFADRLVAQMSSPDILRQQADALSSLATSAALEVSSHQFGVPLGGDPRIAAAVLEAFLIRREQALHPHQSETLYM